MASNEKESSNEEILGQKKLCFIITPIGDNNSEIRRHIDGIIDQSIIPAIGEKYEIVVAHRAYEIGSINDRIIRSIYEADLVIANLTATNPNVMFELAIRYSHGKPAIVIAEQGTKLPFDVIDENTIFYINDPTGANDLRLKISEYEKRIDLERKDYGPVYKVINKIPLYNEVEKGRDVSSEKMLQYIIDRLDAMEKNVNSITIAQDTNGSKYDVSFEEAFVTYYIDIRPKSSEKFDYEELKELKVKLKKYSNEYPINSDIKATPTNIACSIMGKKSFVKKAVLDIEKWLKMKGYQYIVV